jgi:hypothetical protein
MRKASLSLAGLLAVSVLLMVAMMGGTASASPSSSVRIELLRNGPPGSEPTTWSATGAFVDSGTWTLDRFICGACPAPTTGAFQFDSTLTSTSGSIGLHLRAVFNQSVDATFWEIVGGTGVYANLRGHGSYSVTIDGDGVRHIVCVGEVHFA